MVLIRNFVPSAELLLFLCGVLNCPDTGFVWYRELFCIVLFVFWLSVKWFDYNIGFLVCIRMLESLAV